MHVAPSLVRGQGAPTWDRHRVCGVQTAREQGRTLSRGRGRRGGRGARSEATRRRAGSSCCPVSRICTGCGCDAETRLASFRHLASRGLLPAPLRRHFGPCTYHSQPSVRVVCIVSVSPWCLARHAGSSVSRLGLVRACRLTQRLCRLYRLASVPRSRPRGRRSLRVFTSTFRVRFVLRVRHAHGRDADGSPRGAGAGAFHPVRRSPLCTLFLFLFSTLSFRFIYYEYRICYRKITNKYNTVHAAGQGHRRAARTRPQA